MSKPKLVLGITCSLCGTIEPADSYHPIAFCLLTQMVGSKAARANIDAILDHGRVLERLGLPNDAPITAVREPTAEAKRAPKRKGGR